MRRKISLYLLGTTLFICFIAVIFVFLYNKAGLNHYVRAYSYIQSIKSPEKKKQSWNIFNNENKDLGGIYGGIFFGKILVWTTSGPRLFTTDNLTVYQISDGCVSSDIQAIKENDKKSIVLRKYIFNDLKNWSLIAKSGDFVGIIVTKNSMDGKLGNLRQIFTYNFWPFMQQDIKTECAK